MFTILRLFRVARVYLWLDGYHPPPGVRVVCRVHRATATVVLTLAARHAESSASIGPATRLSDELMVRLDGLCLGVLAANAEAILVAAEDRERAAVRTLRQRAGRASHGN